ncbi:MAG: NitT/TauT family transport system permease protein [Acidobacteriota bacterium]|nr:NitT/TauT family transport system permease protein [Acidobacteriota bacterium]
MKKFLPALFFLLVILICWEAIVSVFQIPVYLLPKPSMILGSLKESLPMLGSHFFITCIEAAVGFILGALFGIFLAALFVHSRTLELSLYPYAIALKTVPIVAIAPLLIVWFGNGIFPKIIIAAIISFFPIVVNTVKGMKSIDNEALDLFDSLSANSWQIFIKLRIPTSLPYIFSALKISCTLSVIGAIVGEFSGADKGLGYFILISSYRVQTVDMFVGILMSSILGICFFYLIAVIEYFSIPWAKTKNMTI